MSDHDVRALLAEALDFFNDHPRFSLRRDRRRNSYELASRIEAFLSADERAPATTAITPGQAPSTAALPIKAGAARYRDAIDALPPMTRDVLIAHQQENQSYQEISGRLGITTRDVEHHIAAAIAAISKALAGA
jgi:DNA-directed RNA polymerase specialized sigma24 family protein